MSAREKILGRLRKRHSEPLQPPPSDFSMLDGRQWQPGEKLDFFQSNLESVHGEVHRVPRDTWVDALADILKGKNIGNLLAPREHPIGQALRQQRDSLPTLLNYDRHIEEWREDMFKEVEAGITSTRGGIAETGSLILWPTPDEPRLMSLVPSVHIAVVDADAVYGSFREVLREQQWHRQMPTNALLISGPSKTADIEQTLAYGVHGPKELIVLLRMP